jgi:raffinose/stachyose/melibiose transport system permease protein
MSSKKGFKDKGGYFLSLIFILPSLLLLLYMVFYPIANSIYGSFFEYNGISPQMSFVGLFNYKYVLTDPKFGTSMINNFIWMFMHLFLGCFVGLIIAFLISQVPSNKGKYFFRVVLFLPHVVAMSVCGLIWSMVYNTQYGIIVSVLKHFISDLSWFQPLGNGKIAIYAEGIAANWRAVGYYMVLFLAGLQNIDASLYDAAEIDGAGNWSKFINVTIPGLRNIFTFVLSVALVNGLRGFATVYVMTRGGPGYSTYLVAIYGYFKAFQEMHMGQAMVSALSIGIVIVFITVTFNIIREKMLDY